MTSTPDMRSTFDDLLPAAVEPWGLTPSRKQLDQMGRHYEMMVEANRTTNLTRITTPADAVIKHFADSLALCPWAEKVGLEHIPFSCSGTPLSSPLAKGGKRGVERDTTTDFAMGEARVLDVGTGAGFPGVPLAVMRPAWDVTTIDGTGKKIAFVKEVAAALGLPNLRADAVHADHWKTHRRFDVVIARAVGAVARCLPFAARLTTPGGWFVSYKTPDADGTEVDSVNTLARELHMVRCDPFDYTLATADATLRRRLVIFRNAERLRG